MTTNLRDCFTGFINAARVAMPLTLVLLNFAGLARARDVTAAITGILTDPSGALVPMAMAVVHNSQTNSSFQSKSDSRGVYWLRQLPVGEYTLEVIAPG